MAYTLNIAPATRYQCTKPGLHGRNPFKKPHKARINDLLGVKTRFIDTFEFPDNPTLLDLSINWTGYIKGGKLIYITDMDDLLPSPDDGAAILRFLGLQEAIIEDVLDRYKKRWRWDLVDERPPSMEVPEEHTAVNEHMALTFPYSEELFDIWESRSEEFHKQDQAYLEDRSWGMLGFQHLPSESTGEIEM